MARRSEMAGSAAAANQRSRAARFLSLLGRTGGRGLNMSEITPQLQLEVQNLLFREARLLEEARFREWLDLLSDDIHYAMPVRRTVQPQPAAEHSDPQEVFSLFND